MTNARRCLTENARWRCKECGSMNLMGVCKSPRSGDLAVTSSSQRSAKNLDGQADPIQCVCCGGKEFIPIRTP